MNHALPTARFEPHRAHLLSLARHWLGNHADAQDVVQDTWLRVQSGVPPTLLSDVAWLVTVLRHLCVDRQRRRQRLERDVLADIDHDQCEPSAEHVATRALETQAALRRMAAVLPAPDLAALLLHAVFDFEHGEIAAFAGQSEAAMRQRVHRALRRVKARLASDDPDDQATSSAQEALFALCWRALHGHDAAGLIAQVGRAPVSLRGAAGLQAATTGDPSAAAPRSVSQVVQVDGVIGLAWILDGVVLCTVPMGPCASSREDAVAA